MIVRRTRLTDEAQARLWPDWRHHAFLTDLDGDAAGIDAFHRQHAVTELAIRDLKEGAGMDHVPSGRFAANGAWLCCAVLAHNLIRWTVTLGQARPVDQLTVARTGAPACSASPAASSTRPASSCCAARRAGRGRDGSPAASNDCGRCPPQAEALLAAGRDRGRNLR
jgi:hypothetical protein